jgi:hypothetical protein
MARKSPAETAKMRAAIKESNDEMINRARREALEGIRRLSKPKKPLPAGPSELWPGESMDLGGFTLAKRKQKKSKEGMA